MRNGLLAAAGAFGLIAGCAESGETTATARAGTGQEGAAAATDIDLSKAPSGTYVTEPDHRYITFSYLHQGYSRPYLRWRDWEGVLMWNSEDPQSSSVSVIIDADSIDSGVDEFDGHLKSADFFDTATHPEISFESTSVEKTGPNTGKVTGDLSMKGVTRPVTLDMTLNKADVTRSGAGKLGFSGRTTLKRSEWGLDAYVPFVGDDVVIIIEAELSASAE